MEILGNLGIDWKLLIAQIINFGLLLWLLSKFLYKPIVKRIEKDEGELMEAREQKKELDAKVESFEQRRKKEIGETRSRAREIIKEAEKIAEEIKRETREKAEKESTAIISQSKKRLGSLKLAIEKEISSRVREKIGGSFQKSFTEALSVSLQKKSQNVFWDDFIEKIGQLELGKPKETDLADAMEKFNLMAKEKGKKRQELKKELEEILYEKLGPVKLEYAHPISAEKEKQLEKIVAEKIGLKLKIAKKQNKELISGFRFEIAGRIIESNLLNIADNAANIKPH
ncbi:MAG TPA: hypothetical protein ENG99_01245 [bacterium]|nr:hypothetical protein [bacterium]